MSEEKPIDIHLQLLQSSERSDGANLRAGLEWLDSLLSRLQDCAVPDAMARITDMQQLIKKFQVRISLVGQVKAGKTALTNSLIGKPEMLPSDVNPWTSVVTSVHINTPKPRDHRAVFTFFSQDEWSEMVTGGGRLGEVAQRANFDEEFAEVQEQITAMQTAAERRLGKNFKYLLGSTHNFTGFHPELIKKYVCLGDDEGDTEGRFADVTKSADLFIDDPHYALPTVIRDTPGVNDPFLVRETVTLDNLADSDICVIVLSAHQTFTTVDIALMRILLALQHDQIVLFINRIDELNDPDRQISEIDAYVRHTLIQQGLPEDLPIVFGSALWANAASFGVTKDVLGNSIGTLEKLVDDRLEKDGPSTRPAGMSETNSTKTHDLSGLAELQHVIETKAVKAFGEPFLQKLRTQAFDLCQQSSVLMRQALNNATPIRKDLDVNKLVDQMDGLLSELDTECTRVTKKCSEKMLFDMSAIYRNFISNETKALEAVLSSGGTTGDWDADTDGLRRALNKTYQDFSKNGQMSVQEIFATSAAKVESFYASILDDDSQLFSVTPPTANEARMPTSLMQSMTIDITTGWLETWFTKKLNKSAFAKRMADIVSDDMRTTIHDMREIYIVDFIKVARLQLHDFLASHMQTLQGLSVLDGDKQKSAMRQKLGVDAEVNSRLLEIAEIEAALVNGPSIIPDIETTG
ncbi:dynamin family protein [Roseobacter sp. CCS2]|uniref:dynamin family protein n=1 Tax=Roseobacter sp. CCS2 TaxID=391593 RepID=UPI0018DD8813|nr:dynamin family protein [Roseobacter sp. CCS2]